MQTTIYYFVSVNFNKFLNLRKEETNAISLGYMPLLLSSLEKRTAASGFDALSMLTNLVRKRIYV